MEHKRIRRTKGMLFWKREWYSLCSTHYSYHKDCQYCNAGKWLNVWKVAVGRFFYKRFYGLWYWWVNRPAVKRKSLKFLQQYFPNLK